MSRPTTMKAAVITKAREVVLETIAVPRPGPGQVLVKVFSAAQNPSEWMKLRRFPMTGLPVAGHDFAGIIQEIGPGVPQGLRTVGERVAGFVDGGTSPELGGSFAEYCVADAQLVVTIPNDLNFDAASTVGLAGFTACQALWENQALPTPLEPAKEPFPILIWSGATAVGQFAVQLAKLSGLQVITVASPKNHNLLRSLGADVVFDYHDPDVTQKIKAFSGGRLAHAIDCFSSQESVTAICNSFRDEGGYIAMVLPAKPPRADVKADFTFVYTLLGKEISGPYTYPSMPEHYDLGKKFAFLRSQLLADGTLKTTPVKLVPNGMADAQQWIEYQEQGKVSAQKIVYRICDE